MPDADDTSGAVTALAALAAAESGTESSTESSAVEPAVRRAAHEGLGWLAGLANRDGGIPTFCRGWGRLPFDTSCPDITAHFLRAAEAWQSAGAATRAGHRSLARTQRADGSWEPLWFGNQHHPTQANPAYGTARVVLATLDPRGAAWLIDAVQPDGGVGPAASLCRRPSNGNPL